jgi:hypothetical protein
VAAGAIGRPRVRHQAASSRRRRKGVLQKTPWILGIFLENKNSEGFWYF